jgi:hypothetical protein
MTHRLFCLLTLLFSLSGPAMGTTGDFGPCSLAAKGGAFLDDGLMRTKHLNSFSADEVIAAMDKHSDLISQLRNGPVVMPSGSLSSQLMGELTLATSKEVGLWRLADGSRVLNLGLRGSVGAPSGATRLIAHTHPSGVLNFSDHVNAAGTRVGDVAAFSKLLPNQRSSVLIGPSGAARRLMIPRQ